MIGKLLCWLNLHDFMYKKDKWRPMPLGSITPGVPMKYDMNTCMSEYSCSCKRCGKKWHYVERGERSIWVLDEKPSMKPAWMKKLEEQ